MFTAALFTVPKVWKQPQFPCIDEWVKKWCIYIMSYDLTMKYEILPFAATWMNFEDIMLSDRRERQMLYGLIYMCNEKKGKKNKKAHRYKEHITVCQRG